MTELIEPTRPSDVELRHMADYILASAIITAEHQSVHHPRPVERARWRRTYDTAVAIADSRLKRSGVR